MPSLLRQVTVCVWVAELLFGTQLAERVWVKVPEPQVGLQAVYSQVPVPPTQAPNPEACQL